MDNVWKEMVRPQSLRQHVIDQIIYAIANGHLKPGERIGEADLAQNMGISRGPVREALSTLSQDGIVENIPYKGTFVCNLTRKEINEVFTLRAVLEEFAVRQIIVSCKEETVRKLWSRYDELVETVKSGQLNKIAEADMNFHEALVQAAGHDHLYRAWNPLRYRVLLYSILTIEKRYSSFDSFIELHAKLIQSIETGNTVTAALEINDHIINAGENLLLYIKENE